MIDETMRARIVNFYVDHANRSISETINHFKKEKIWPQTIRRIVHRYEETGTTVRKPGQGRKPSVLTPQNLNKLKKMFTDRDDWSFRRAAKKFDTCHRHISRTLSEKCNIKCRKKKLAPKYKEGDEEDIKRKCSRLSRMFQGNDIILDDEKYFSLKDQIHKLYYSSDANKAPNKVKFRESEKYTPKVLVWLAGSSKGISKVYIHTSKNAIDSDVYISKCMPKLKAFIDEQHKDGKYWFWPDKAKCHYSNATKKFYGENKIRYVPIENNPTNLPQARPIEDLWAVLDRMVWSGRVRPKNIESLIKRIKYCVRNIDPEVVKATFSSVKKRVRECGLNGPYSIVH